MAEMTKVWIEDGECISCDECIQACPEVFEMGDDTAVVKAEAQDGDTIQQHSDEIVEAAEACPVDAIKYE